MSSNFRRLVGSVNMADPNSFRSKAPLQSRIWPPKASTTFDNPALPFPTFGFSAQFPDRSIDPGDTLMIVLHENYRDFYGENFIADLIMFGLSVRSYLMYVHTLGMTQNWICNL